MYSSNPMQSNVQMAIMNLEATVHMLKQTLNPMYTGYQYPHPGMQPQPNNPYGYGRNPFDVGMGAVQSYSQPQPPAWITDVKREGDIFTFSSRFPTGAICKDVIMTAEELKVRIEEIASRPRGQMEYFQSLKSPLNTSINAWRLSETLMLVVVGGLSQVVVNAGKFVAELPHIPYVDLSGSVKKQQPQGSVSWVTSVELNAAGDVLTTTKHLTLVDRTIPQSYSTELTIRETTSDENTTLEELYNHWNDQTLQLNQVYNLLDAGIVKTPKTWRIGELVVVSIENVGTGVFNPTILKTLDLPEVEVITLSESVDSVEAEVKTTDGTPKLSSLSDNELWEWFDKPVESAQWASESDDANLVLASSDGTSLELDIPFTKLAEETFTVIDGRNMSAMVKRVNKGEGEMVIVHDEHSDLCLVQQVDDEWHSTTYVMDKVRAGHYAATINDVKKLKVFPTVI